MENNTVPDEEVKKVVFTMMNQIGGSRFLQMIGANLPYSYTYKASKCEYAAMIHFKAKANNGLNGLILSYCEGRDTYRMDFYRISKGYWNLKITHDDVYCDQLEFLFVQTTGLATRI
ncbi:MAG: hypothetical protein M0R17_00870 [Candidatus Omnitrophica bacterium]|jgi:hypothetical protein|nr:hypothetical protein [Candidatus Omnitrophota bacterium]